MIYLDNASTTQVDARLEGTIRDYTFNYYGNAGSPHRLGRTSREAVDAARDKLAASVKTDKENIIFTSCGSEANTLAIIGSSNHLLQLGLNHIITTKYEHRSVLNAMREMERRGFTVTYLDALSGVVSYDDFISAVNDNTGLVSIMYVNNEIGSINDVQQIYQFCRERKILFHSDCVQAFGMMKVDMECIADMVSISGHKIHAPKGIGCLCTKNKEFLSNIIYGGEQEFGIRPGTENVANIVAFGDMALYAEKHRSEFSSKLYGMSDFFVGQLVLKCRQNNIPIHFNPPGLSKFSKIVSICFDGVDAETLMIMLESKGVQVSAGSACSSMSTKPSHVLKAIGLTDEEARSTIRVSFSDYNTIKEMEMAAKIIVECVVALRSINETE